jgi:hypothetical protein
MNEKLLELHIDYEMSLVSTENLKDTIKKEIISYLEWAKDKSFSNLFPKQKAESRLKEIINRSTVNEKTLNLIKKSISASYNFLDKDNTKLNELINREDFISSANSTIGLRNAREKIIQFIVNSSAYSRMMSSIIYAAIKDFLAENPITKNNPVASSFMKMGADFLNNLPGMQGNFDATITDFLRNNLSGRIQQSEKLIREELETGKNTEELLTEIWNFLGTIPLSEIKNLLPEKEVISFLERTPAFWDYLKSKGFVEKVAFHQLNEFYLYFGEKSIAAILEEIGISKEEIADGLSEGMFIYLDNQELREYYRIRVKDRLSGFYMSTKVQNLIK